MANGLTEAETSATASVAGLVFGASQNGAPDAALLDWLSINFRSLSMDFYDGERYWCVRGVRGTFATLREAVRAGMGLTT
jgi:hypothetical protein